MKHQLHINLDAALSLMLVFILLIGFLFYQHHQYSVLHDQHVQLQWQIIQEQMNLQSAQARVQELQQQISPGPADAPVASKP